MSSNVSLGSSPSAEPNGTNLSAQPAASTSPQVDDPTTKREQQTGVSEIDLDRRRQPGKETLVALGKPVGTPETDLDDALSSLGSADRGGIVPPIGHADHVGVRVALHDRAGEFGDSFDGACRVRTGGHLNLVGGAPRRPSEARSCQGWPLISRTLVS